MDCGSWPSAAVDAGWPRRVQCPPQLSAARRTSAASQRCARAVVRTSGAASRMIRQTGHQGAQRVITDRDFTTRNAIRQPRAAQPGPTPTPTDARPSPQSNCGPAARPAQEPAAGRCGACLPSTPSSPSSPPASSSVRCPGSPSPLASRGPHRRGSSPPTAQPTPRPFSRNVSIIFGRGSSSSGLRPPARASTYRLTVFGSCLAKVAADRTVRVRSYAQGFP